MSSSSSPFSFDDEENPSLNPKKSVSIHQLLQKKNANAQKTLPTNSTSPPPPPTDLPPNPSVDNISQSFNSSSNQEISSLNENDDSSSYDSNLSSDDDIFMNDSLENKLNEPFIQNFPLNYRTKNIIYRFDKNGEPKISSTTIDISMTRFNSIFWIEIIEIMYAATILLISYLILGDFIQINNYIFLIVGSIISLIILSFHIFSLFFYNRGNPELSTRHNTALIITALVAVGAQIFIWLSLGRWIITYGICCETSQNQPNPLDIANYTRFINSYTIMFVLSIIMISFGYPRSIVCHLYPEVSMIESKKHN